MKAFDFLNICAHAHTHVVGGLGQMTTEFQGHPVKELKHLTEKFEQMFDKSLMA